jgi:hypothetical protein
MKQSLPNKLGPNFFVYLPGSVLLFYLSYLGFAKSRADMAVIGLCLGALLLQLSLSRLWAFWQMRRGRKF